MTSADKEKSYHFFELLFCFRHVSCVILMGLQRDIYPRPRAASCGDVFLRELEYFDGVLFLTTNRVKSFDPAILSRIHLGLNYGSLEQDARRAVLQFVLAQAKTKKGPHTCRERAIEDLAKEDLNGRDIRNAVLVAQAMAEYKNEVVSEDHLKVAIAMRKEIQVDVHGAGAIENRNAYL
ncbi:hypothetical protein NKR23_g2145 [Pleurostoma richardsiae]|uniref:ATPase AAA-type core domain-containing protein n=1 Tax=Pleurostoma richardsiae TaxID=41990 RepID=A0AA38S2R5_9PEZI|nr:hypothetical protein NKR23_g2145 [Pleurostoma richardsiae]